MFQRCVTWPCFVSMSSSSLWPPVFDTLYLPVGYFSAVLPGPVSSRWVLHLRDHLSLSRLTYVCDFSALCYLALFRLDEFFIFVTISLCHVLPTCAIFQRCVTWPCFVSMSSSSSRLSVFVSHALLVWFFSAVLPGPVSSGRVRHLRDHLSLSRFTYLCDVSVLCYLALFRLDVFVIFVTICLCHTVPVWCFSAVLPGPVSSRCVRRLSGHLFLSYYTCVMFQCSVTWPCFVSTS